MKILSEIIPNIHSIFSCKDNINRELIASIIGALLVIPQAITFAYLAGLPPEYGIYSAIFVTLIASLFGSTPMLGGPNTAVAILIGMTVSPYAGMGSPLFIEYAIILSIMVGLFQLTFWIFRGARIFDFFSPSGIVGITSGVGFILIISSIDGMLGLSRTENTFFYEKIYYSISSFDDIVNYLALLIAIITIISGLVIKYLNCRYYILFSILIGSIFGYIITVFYPPVISDIEKLGYIPMNIDFSIPSFTNEHFIVAEKMIVDAIIIAFVGTSQSLIITKDLSRRLNKSYNQNKEVFAQGMANTASGFFGGFAGSGSFNRTVINIEAGSKSQIPGILSGAIIVLVILVLNSVIAHIPMAVISGVLFLVGVAMFDIKKLKQVFENNSHKTIFIIVFSATILLGLKIGIILSLIISIIIYVQNTSSISCELSNYKGIQILNISGNLFYATVDQLRTILNEQDSNKKILINIDSTGLVDECCVNQINSLNNRGVGSVGVLCKNADKKTDLKKMGINCPVFKNFDLVKQYYLPINGKVSNNNQYN